MAELRWIRLDLQILAILQRDSLISKAELAARVGLSPSTCHELMRRLERQKAILSYHANRISGTLARNDSNRLKSYARCVFKVISTKNILRVGDGAQIDWRRPA